MVRLLRGADRAGRGGALRDELDCDPAVPDTVSAALAELAGEMREGLLALAVGTGLQVMAR
jgi:hypothetical protein